MNVVDAMCIRQYAEKSITYGVWNACLKKELSAVS